MNKAPHQMWLEILLRVDQMTWFAYSPFFSYFGIYNSFGNNRGPPYVNTQYSSVMMTWRHHLTKDSDRVRTRSCCCTPRSHVGGIRRLKLIERTAESRTGYYHAFPVDERYIRVVWPLLNLGLLVFCFRIYYVIFSQYSIFDDVRIICVGIVYRCNRVNTI